MQLLGADAVTTPQRSGTGQAECTGDCIDSIHGDAATNRDLLIEWTCPNSGDYYVQVSSLPPYQRAGARGSFTMSIAKMDR